MKKNPKLIHTSGGVLGLQLKTVKEPSCCLTSACLFDLLNSIRATAQKKRNGMTNSNSNKRVFSVHTKRP